MPNEALVKKINTPPESLLKKFAEESLEIDFSGKKIRALDLDASGGFGTTFLYKDEAKSEYRILKVYHTEEMKYGGLERRVKSFNDIYESVYDHDLASLASAAIFNGSKKILDMPYIGGSNYFNFHDSQLLRADKIQKLLYYFMKHHFFISDYDLRGNIMCFTDPETNRNYILIRDIDLVGRRDSFELHGNQSVTYEILKNPSSIERDIYEDDFRSVLEWHKQKEIKTESLDDSKHFQDIKSLLLAKITSEHGKNTEVSNAKNFQELCFIAAQKRKTHKLSSDEGFTRVLNNLYDLVKNDEEKLTAFQLPPELTKYDLQEIGFHGAIESCPLNPNFKLRKKNLMFIYSIQHGEEFKPQLEALRGYSLFKRDYRTVPAIHPAQPTSGASFIKK